MDIASDIPRRHNLTVRPFGSYSLPSSSSAMSPETRVSEFFFRGIHGDWASQLYIFLGVAVGNGFHLLQREVSSFQRAEDYTYL